MSDDEFSYYKNNPTNVVDKNTLDSITTRLKQLKDNIRMRSANICDQVYDFLDYFNPDIANMLDGYESVPDYWVKKLNPLNIAYIKHPDDIGVVVHESQHEISALKSGIFKSHSSSGNYYYVHYTNKPSTYNWYSPYRDQWISAQLNGLGLPSSGYLIGKIADKDLKDSSLYKQYITNSGMASNTWGLAGILMEASSCTVDNHIVYTCYNLNRFNHVEDTEIPTADGMFWIDTILGYLASYSEYSESRYDKLLSNEDLIDASYEIVYYLLDEINGAGEISSYEYELYTDWFSCDELQDQIVKLICTYNKIDEGVIRVYENNAENHNVNSSSSTDGKYM